MSVWGFVTVGDREGVCVIACVIACVILSECGFRCGCVWCEFGRGVCL